MRDPGLLESGAFFKNSLLSEAVRTESAPSHAVVDVANYRLPDASTGKLSTSSINRNAGDLCERALVDCEFDLPSRSHLQPWIGNNTDRITISTGASVSAHECIQDICILLERLRDAYRTEAAAAQAEQIQLSGKLEEKPSLCGDDRKAATASLVV